MEGPGSRTEAARTSDINQNSSCIALGKPCNGLSGVFVCFVFLAIIKKKIPAGAVVLNKIMHMNDDSFVWHVVVWDE